MAEIPMKKCTGPCGRELPATDEYFSRFKAAPDGFGYICKQCARAAARLYYQANREKRLAQVKAYRQAHAETIREAQLRRRQEGRSYDKMHPEDHKAYCRTYNEAHREKLRLQNRRSHQGNKERNNTRARNYYKNNRDEYKVRGIIRRTRKQSLPNTFSVADLQRAHEYWGGICPCCGKQIYDLFGEISPHADHWIPLSSPNCPGTVPWNMVILCSRCNLSKSDKEPRIWVMEKFGKRQGAAILKRIDEYFASLQP